VFGFMWPHSSQQADDMRARDGAWRQVLCGFSYGKFPISSGGGGGQFKFSSMSLDHAKVIKKWIYLRESVRH
jgi:hypothetical protein